MTRVHDDAPFLRELRRVRDRRGSGLRWDPDRVEIVPQVRAWLGKREDTMRVIDSLGIDLYDHEIDVFEFKRFKGDVKRETPEKIAPFRVFARRCWIVVPAPRKKIIASFDELPGEHWGLIEIGGGQPSVIREATEATSVEPPSSDLWAAIVRAQRRALQRDESYPMRPIVSANRTLVVLSCGHQLPRGMWKKTLPTSVECKQCPAAEVAA